MTRNAASWLVALTLAVVGTQLAHAAAYRLAATQHGETPPLAAGVHGYLAYAPSVLALALAVAFAALVRELHAGLERREGGRPARVPLLAFAVIAPIAFAAQELVERLLETGAVPSSALVEPTFLLGLGLQLPFALAAYAAARLLLRTARAIATSLAGGRTIHARREAVRPRWHVSTGVAPRPADWLSARRVRGPPSPA